MATEPKEVIEPPLEFFIKGEIQPIKLTFLCKMPGGGEVAKRYAIYHNHATQDPQRVHLPSITEKQLSYAEMFLEIRERAISRVRHIEEIMKAAGVEVPF